jgi:hypothetical protein
MICSVVSPERLFLDDVQNFTDTLERLRLRVGDVGEPSLDASLHELTQAIRTMSRKCRLLQLRCGPEELAAHRRAFQQRIAPWFDTSWMMRRAKAKPRGYPGDFELLTAIYDGVPKSTGLGGYLDLYFLHSDLAQAVRARMR